MTTVCFFYRIICGLTGFTTKNHIIRAALEAICFQTRDIIEGMQADMGIKLMKMNADGPMGGNNLLMQLQADLCGVPVRKCFLFFCIFAVKFNVETLLSQIDSKNQVNIFN